MKSEDNKDNIDGEEENKFQEESKLVDSTRERANKKKEQESSLVNSNGFNTDYKKYIPLTILNYSFLYSIIVLIIIIASLIPIYLLTIQMVNNTNQLIIVQNYLLGKLIVTSTSTIEIKCFMSSCKNDTTADYADLVNMDLIQEVIKGVNIFPEVSVFYNEKFLLDACAAAMPGGTDSEDYIKCLDDNLIVSANNTDNLLKLVDDLVDNIKKEYEMNTNIDKKTLYSTTYFKQIEYMFYNYLFNVGDNFADVVNRDLNKYLYERQLIVIIIAILIGVVIVIYCLVFGIILIKRLVHHLSVSRCIMKIIPTTVIISTQELETWIENKY
jgi:hypothetical protein